MIVLLACSAALCRRGCKAEGEQLIFWAAEQPVFVRLSLDVEGQTHSLAWNAAAGRLFDAFDRNGDGTLTSDEDLPGLLALVSLELVSDPGVARGTEAAPLSLRRDCAGRIARRSRHWSVLHRRHSDAADEWHRVDRER